MKKQSFSETIPENVRSVASQLYTWGFKKLLIEYEEFNSNSKFKGIDVFMNISGVLVLGLRDKYGYVLMEAHTNVQDTNSEVIPLSFNSVMLGGNDLVPFLETLKKIILNGRFVMPWTEKPINTMYAGFNSMIDSVWDKIFKGEKESFGNPNVKSA